MASTQPPAIRKHQILKPLAWEEIREPGAYVEVSTGTLYRVREETLIEGAASLIEMESEAGSQLVQVDRKPFALSKFVQLSKNPLIFSLGARMICANHDIQPRF